MKISLLSAICLLASGSVFAQLPVSTTVQNRKVVLEEFTGYSCQYCPDGHKRADQLAANFPGEVLVINIHAGSYAGNSPDFKTPYGTAIVGQTGLTGYPAGTVNRTLFPTYSQNTSSPGTAMSRGNWATTANTILSQQSYVNVALEAVLDTIKREIKVDVEVYYTGNSPETTNFLHLALVQDSIMGPQTGGATWYPAMMFDGKYQHNKMLREMLSGQWGDEIPTTTQGTLFTKKYTYTIPNLLPEISSGTKTEVLLNKIRLIAYVTETKQVIVSGNTGPIKIYDMYASVKENAVDEKINVYPNPFKNSATISVELNKSEVVDIRIYNLLGAEVFNYNKNLDAGINYVPFDGSDLQDGVYILTVKNGNKFSTKKLTLVR